MVEKIAERFDKARIITKARVKDLIITDGACTGCIYEKGGVDFKEFGPVIFASGGFGADFAPEFFVGNVPIKMGEAFGAKNHRPRVGPGAHNRLGEARRPRWKNQVLRSGKAGLRDGRDVEAEISIPSRSEQGCF